MKISWDNIDSFRLTANGGFRYKNQTVYLFDLPCPNCGDIYYSTNKNQASCSGKCKRLTSLHKSKLKQSAPRGKDKYNWKGGGVYSPYDTYHERLQVYEDIRCVDGNKLEVRCFKCDGWFRPTRIQSNNRLLGISGKHGTHNHFYCSDNCKSQCRVFRKRPDTLVKEDEIASGVREESRDNYYQQVFREQLIKKYGEVCEICHSTERVEAHHIIPVSVCENILTWDLDNGIMVCKECHLRRLHQDECSSINLWKLKYENKEK